MSEETNETVVIEESLKLLVDKKDQRAKLDDEIKELETALNTLAGQPDKVSGVVKLDGETLQAKITRKVNVSYPGEGKNVLASLLKKFKDELMPLFRIEFKESGQKVAKYLEDSDSEVAKALAEIRVSKPGKPYIEVLAKKKV